MNDFPSREEIEAYPDLDFAQINRPTINDLVDLGIDLPDDVPEIVLQAIEAIQAIDIPGGSVSAYQTDDGTYVIRNDIDILLPDPESGGPSVFPNENVPDGLTIEGATTHGVGASIHIDPTADGGYTFKMRVDHEGSIDGTIDASTTIINYQIDENGNFLDRNSGASTQEFGVNITEQDHGMWTIEAAQAIEHRFGQIVGMGNPGAAEKLDALRPDTAATEVSGPPPLPEGMQNLSSYDIEALVNGETPNVEQRTAPAIDLGSPG